MRAAMILGCLLVASSAFAQNEIPLGSLEKFGSTGLPQTETEVKVAVVRPVKVSPRVTKETQVPEGSLEKFGATGLGQ